jgi:FixJ family two-component response regulator
VMARLSLKRMAGQRRLGSTGHGSQPMSTRSCETGANNYLSKPWRFPTP